MVLPPKFPINMNPPANNLNAALAIVAQDIPVAPAHSMNGGCCTCGKTDCSSPAKHPRTGHGVKDVTCDPNQIASWWGKWPDANIMIATGAVAGIWALDIDPKSGGVKSLAKLEKTHGKLPSTVEVMTGGGGQHLYFKHPGGKIANSAGKLGDGLDVRGDGGFVIAPPSNHASGGTYSWCPGRALGEVPMANAPDWLLDLVRTPTKSSGAMVGPVDAGPTASSEQGFTELQRAAKRIVTAEPGRQECTLNDESYRVGTLVGRGEIDFRQAFEALVTAGLKMTNDPAKKPWTRREIEKKVDRALRKGHSKGGTLSTRSAADLATAVFTEPRWAVRDLIPEGAIILAGKPKLGKSFLALHIALAVGLGERVLDALPTIEGDVLYLALEDNERRLQRRIRQMLGRVAPSRVDFACQCPRLDQGGLVVIRKWLLSHPGARLVVIDTLAKVRPPRSQGRGIYDDDYACVASLKTLADEFRVAVLIVHHERKAQADDFLDSVSGTAGITGAADTVFVLRRERAQADGVLYVTGRDIEEAELALRFDTATGRWALLGEADEYRRSPQRQEIVDALRRHPQGLMPADVSEVLTKTTQREKDAIRQLLRRMAKAGDIECFNGRYRVHTTDTSQQSLLSQVSQDADEASESRGCHDRSSRKCLNRRCNSTSSDGVTAVTDEVTYTIGPVVIRVPAEAWGQTRTRVRIPTELTADDTEADEWRVPI